MVTWGVGLDEKNINFKTGKEIKLLPQIHDHSCSGLGSGPGRQKNYFNNVTTVTHKTK